MRTSLVSVGLATLVLCGCAQADGDASRAAAGEALASASAAAAEAEQAVDRLNSSTAELCKGESDAAERIMSARQKGAAMADLMVTATKYGEPYIGFVRKAYEVPHVTTESVANQAIGDFRDTAYKDCLKRWDF